MTGKQAAIHGEGLVSVDPVWGQISKEAEEILSKETALSGFILSNILNHKDLETAIIHRLSNRLDHKDVPADQLRRAFADALDINPSIAEAIRADIAAVYDRDPACHRLIEPVLYFKGFHAVQTHRFSNALYSGGQKDIAYYLQSQVARTFQVDIHPAVPIGKGIMFDHASSIIIGETAILEDDVSILQGVTLGGTGKEEGDRHPKIRRGVLIGAGAKVLGNIEIGHCSRVAAGSVVLKDVPPNSTVVGVPAKVVGVAQCPEPARSMNHMLNIASG